jgi:hypothetical protein
MLKHNCYQGWSSPVHPRNKKKAAFGNSEMSNTSDTRHDGLTPTIVGEFSLSAPDNVQWSDAWHPNSQQTFYRRWFAAMVSTYEKDTAGWGVLDVEE